MVSLKTSSSAFRTWPELYPGAPDDVQLRRIEFIESVDEFGTGDPVDFHQRTKRHLAAVGAANIKLVDVRDIRSGCAFCLNIGLPLAAESIEVVNEIAAHEGLHGCVDVGEIDLLLQRLLLVDIGIRVGVLRAGKTE